MTFNECLNLQYEIIDVWKEFLCSIENQNEIILPKRFGNLLSETFKRIPRFKIEDKDYYRARIVSPSSIKKLKTKPVKSIKEMMYGESGLCGLPKDEMGAPPREISCSGRANHKGTSYLYIADSPITACAEVKPILSDLISVCRFQISKELKLADFRCIRNCKLSDLNRSEFQDAKIIEFMKYVLGCYSEPVDKSDENGYKASQTITELLKKRNFDGVIYESGLNAFNGGYNIVLFDPSQANFVNDSSELYKCTKTTSEFQNISLSNIKSCVARTDDEHMEWSEIVLFSKELENNIL